MLLTKRRPGDRELTEGTERGLESKPRSWTILGGKSW